jgi:hypothetical protein
VEGHHAQTGRRQSHGRRAGVLPCGPLVNGVGAVITGIVALVFAVTKFGSGAWVVLIVIAAT